MDLDGDGFLDLVTINDGDIVKEQLASRREHVFRNDGKGRFRDATDNWWPDAANVGDDDNMARSSMSTPTATRTSWSAR